MTEDHNARVTRFRQYLRENRELAALPVLLGAIWTVAYFTVPPLEEGELHPNPGTPGQIEQAINFYVEGWPWSVAVPLLIVAVTVTVTLAYRRWKGITNDRE